MSPEAKRAKAAYMREYMRKWRAKPENKRKIREYQQKYWQRKAEEEFLRLAGGGSE